MAAELKKVIFISEIHNFSIDAELILIDRNFFSFLIFLFLFFLFLFFSPSCSLLFFFFLFIVLAIWLHFKAKIRSTDMTNQIASLSDPDREWPAIGIERSGSRYAFQTFGPGYIGMDAILMLQINTTPPWLITTFPLYREISKCLHYYDVSLLFLLKMRHCSSL